MFVPRALRLKGVKESQKSKQSKPNHTDSAIAKSDTNNENTLIDAMGKTSMASQAPQDEQVDPEAIIRGPRFTTAPVTPEFIAQLAAGVELIFTDYAHQHPESAKWLHERYRAVDGEEDYIHLTAILEHPHISCLKPEATQVLLRQAVAEHGAPYLEQSANGFYIRRRPSTYPLAFVPKDSFSVVNHDGLSFWDQRTIYVEPHIRHLCRTPAKVAHWLREQGHIKTKWMPIQAVHTLYNSCAFVVLSGNVTHEDAWKKWRELGQPKDWNVMTKIEHTKRTNEYLESLKKRDTDVMLEYDAPVIPGGRDVTVIQDTQDADATEEHPRGRAKRKRKRKKGNKVSGIPVDEDTNMAGDVDAETSNSHTNKRRA